MNIANGGVNDLVVNVEVTGGLELFFSNQREHTIILPKWDQDGKASTLGHLIRHICENVLKGKKKEMFVIDGNIRPGVLVLVNDADWELEGESDYELREGDKILFVSTLHGG